MSRAIVLAILATGLVVPGSGRGQERPDPAAAPDREAILAAASGIMRAAGACFMITLDSDGHPQARVLDPFPPEEGMVVWLGTNARTRKVAQVRNDPRATLCYYDAAKAGYVSLLGRVEIVDAAAEKAARWKEGWASLYEEGHAGEDYLLLRFTPFELELVSYGDGIVNEPGTWAPVSVPLP